MLESTQNNTEPQENLGLAKERHFRISKFAINILQFASAILIFVFFFLPTALGQTKTGLKAIVIPLLILMILIALLPFSLEKVWRNKSLIRKFPLSILIGLYLLFLIVGILKEYLLTFLA